MAGSFGFEPGTMYDVSIKCGERVLLPAVRQARQEDLIIADGFSCKTQIEQGTERRALHLAQVLQMALRNRGQGQGTERPETPFVRGRQAEFRAANRRALAVVGGVAAAGLLGWLWLGKRSARLR
jgi:hypothetical protein